MNHQELLCSLHCATTVVLREQLNFKSAVIRSERSSCFIIVMEGSYRQVILWCSIFYSIPFFYNLGLLSLLFTACCTKGISLHTAYCILKRTYQLSQQSDFSVGYPKQEINKWKCRICKFEDLYFAKRAL